MSIPEQRQNNLPPRQEGAADVVFENAAGFPALKYYTETRVPHIVTLLQKCSGGLIEDEKKAVYALIAISLVVLAISLLLFLGVGSEVEPNGGPPAILNNV